MTTIYLDVETTGLSPQKDDIIQLAYKKKGDKEIFCELYKARRPIPFEITGFTNIEDQDVADKDLFTESQAYKDLKELANQDHWIITHNTDFDLGFLNSIDINFPNSICTMWIAKKLLKKQLYNHKLGTLRAYYHIPLPQKGHAHDARFDVEVLSQIFEKMKENFKDLQDMADFEKQARIEALGTWQFGKYRGQVIDKKKHGDYINWWLNADDPKYPKDPKLVKYLEKILSGEIDPQATLSNNKIAKPKNTFPDGKLF